MVLKRILYPLIVFCSLWGCSSTTGSGASAPPVSLPAPVTGRLTVTSPDESGVALVIGDDGAVPADSLVHAVNESQTTASLVAAQATLPEQCGQSFHGCALADANGSFEMEIAASEEDSIIVGILDQTTGATISERTRQPVPRNIRHFVRPVIEVDLLNNTVTGDRKLYALMAQTDTEPNGLISVVDLPTNVRTVVPFAGPRPAKIGIHTNTRIGALTDPIGNTLSLVNLASDNFDAPTLQASLPNPTDVIFNTNGNEVFVSTANTGVMGNFLHQINPATLAINASLNNSNLQTFIAGATNVATRSLDLIRFTTTIGFDLIAFAGIYDVAGTPTAAVGLAQDATFNLLALTPLPAGANPQDVAFFRTQDRLIVTDSGNDAIHVYAFSTNFPDAATVSNLTLEGTVSDPNGLVINPMDIGIDTANELAFINAANGTTDRPDTVLTIDLATLEVVDIHPIGHGPSGIVYDPTGQILFCSTSKSHSITFWGLADLLP